MLRFLAKGFIILLVLCFFGLSTLCGAIRFDDFKDMLEDGKVFSQMLSEDFDALFYDLQEQIDGLNK